MNRRDFLTSLPAAAAIGTAAEVKAAPLTAATVETDHRPGDFDRPSPEDNRALHEAVEHLNNAVAALDEIVARHADCPGCDVCFDPNWMANGLATFAGMLWGQTYSIR